MTRPGLVLIVATIVAAVLAVADVAWPGPAAISADQPEPEVVLGFQAEAMAGATVAIAAYLVDPAGNPIADEEISFTIASSFMNVDGQMDIGAATTDVNGLALLPYAPRIEGERVILARFDGNDVFAPARASDALLVTPGPQLHYEFSPLRIPGANIWMAASVLTAVWGVFLFVCALIWRIAYLGVAGSGVSDD